MFSWLVCLSPDQAVPVRALADDTALLHSHSASLLPFEGLRAKRTYIEFLADFHFLQDQANFWQTDLF